MNFNISVLVFVCQLLTLLIITCGLYKGHTLEDFRGTILLFLFTLVPFPNIN